MAKQNSLSKEGGIFIEELAYSFHIGSDKNKKRTARLSAKNNKSGTTSLSNNAIQNAQVLSRVDKHNYRKYDNDQENIIIIKGSSSIVDDVKDLYKKEFEKARLEYNEKRVREDRKIDDYFTHISNNSKNDLACEIIIELGDKKYWDTKDDDYKRKMTNVYKKQVEDLKNVVIYGDGNYVPSWDNGVATYSLPSNLRSDNKRYEVSIELENNYTIDNIKEKIDSYIKNNLDNEFDINNYQYDITGTGNKKYYDFKLLINGAISDSAYTVIVENNEIVAIVDNTKEISNNISTYSSNNINSDEQEELANKIKNNIIEENSNYEVISQKLKNIYISEENAYKTLILTEVHDKLTDSYFVKEDIL